MDTGHDKLKRIEYYDTDWHICIAGIYPEGIGMILNI